MCKRHMKLYKLLWDPIMLQELLAQPESDEGCNDVCAGSQIWRNMAGQVQQR